MNDSRELSLHHIGYAVKTIAPPSEHYIQRFGYKPATPILHDPLQTAFVQFLSLPGDRVYLELVAPDGPQSKLQNGVRSGGKFHHLCYATSHLEDAIEQFKVPGVVLVSGPKPAAALGGRRICWLLDENSMLIELVERNDATDLCAPGVIEPFDPGLASEGTAYQ